MKIIFLEKVDIIAFFHILFFKFSEKIQASRLKIFFFEDNNFFIKYVFKLIFGLHNFNKITYNFDSFKNSKNETVNYIAEHDVCKILECIYENDNFKKVNKETDNLNSFALFIIKKVCLGKLPNTSFNLNNFLVNLFACKKKLEEIKTFEKAIYFTSCNYWIEEINKFSNTLDLEIRTLKKYQLNLQLINNFKNLKYNKIILKIYIFFQNIFNLNKNFNRLKKFENSNKQNITIESDFDYLRISKFWKIEKLEDKKNFLFISKRFSPHLNQLFIENKLNNINYFRLTNKFIKNKNECEIFFNYNKKKNINVLTKFKNDFDKEKMFWLSYFKKSNTKIYCTDEIWSYHTACAISAINEIGGVSCAIQTSYPAAGGNLVPWGITNSDVFFCLTKKIMHDHSRLNFKDTYLVTSGYPLDYEVYNDDKNFISEKNFLISNGAKRIISYFDINFTVEKDKRWMPSEVIINDYEFLLKKLLENKWLGLILKPKKRFNILKKIPKIKNLIEEGIKTKRLIIIDQKKRFRAYDISKISDVSIHASLNGTTSGYESSFYKKPVFFLNRDNWKASCFNVLDKNEVIFSTLEKLWLELHSNWQETTQKNILSWKKNKNIFDNFDDGKSNERLIDFLNFLYINLNNGYEKKKAIEVSVGKYKEKWGNDLVYKINKSQDEIDFSKIYKD